MKLLFENWREYLNERATDTLYQKVIDFLIDTILNEKFSEHHPEESWWEEDDERYGEEEDDDIDYEALVAMVADTEFGREMAAANKKREGYKPPQQFLISIDQGQLKSLWELYQKKST